jgi:hypothetical protein
VRACVRVHVCMCVCLREDTEHGLEWSEAGVERAFRLLNDLLNMSDRGSMGAAGCNKGGRKRARHPDTTSLSPAAVQGGGLKEPRATDAQGGQGEGQGGGDGEAEWRDMSVVSPHNIPHLQRHHRVFLATDSPPLRETAASFVKGRNVCVVTSPFPVVHTAGAGACGDSGECQTLAANLTALEQVQVVCHASLPCNRAIAWPPRYSPPSC